MIKVSVVVPVYNVEKYLARCLESLANQTLKEIEVIVVNDGSKDGSQHIIDDFVQRYPQQFKSLIKENGGLSDARNFGIPHCQGEYIGFVDSDDYVDPNMYETLYNEACQIHADIVVCDYLKEYPAESKLIRARKYAVSKDMFMGGLAAAWNKIYKKELIQTYELSFPKGLIYEDTEFYCKLIPHVKVCGYVAKPFVHYVQREGSIANDSGAKTRMIFSIFDNIYQYYREHGYLSDYCAELEYFMIRVLLGSSMERICKCPDASTRSRLLQETLTYLSGKNPQWKKNRYISMHSDKRSIYYKAVNKWNINLIATLFRFYFSRNSSKLFR